MTDAKTYLTHSTDGRKILCGPVKLDAETSADYTAVIATHCLHCGCHPALSSLVLVYLLVQPENTEQEKPLAT